MLCMHIYQIAYNLSITKLTRVPIFNWSFIKYKEFDQICTEYLYLIMIYLLNFDVCSSKPKIYSYMQNQTFWAF